MQKYIFFFQIYPQKYHKKGTYKNKKCCKSAIHSTFAVEAKIISMSKHVETISCPCFLSTLQRGG